MTRRGRSPLLAGGFAFLLFSGAWGQSFEWRPPSKLLRTETGNIPHLVRGVSLGGRPAIFFLEHPPGDETGFGISLRVAAEEAGAWRAATVIEGSRTARVFLFDAVGIGEWVVVGAGVVEDQGANVRFLRRSGEAWEEVYRHEVELSGHFEQHMAMTSVDGRIVALAPDDSTSQRGRFFLETADGWRTETAPLDRVGSIDLISAATAGGAPWFAASNTRVLQLGHSSEDVWAFENVYSGYGKVAEWGGRPAILATLSDSTAIRFLHRPDPGGAWEIEPIVEGGSVRSADLAVAAGVPVAAFFDVGREPGLVLAERRDGAWHPTKFPGVGDNWLNAIDVFLVEERPFVTLIDERDPKGHCLLLLEPAPAARELRRGDANGDSRIDISDAIWLIAFLARGGRAPACLDAGDVNDDGRVDLTDPIAVIHYSLLAGAPPSAPFTVCGLDPTIDELPCEEAPACRR